MPSSRPGDPPVAAAPPSDDWTMTLDEGAPTGWSAASPARRAAARAAAAADADAPAARSCRRRRRPATRRWRSRATQPLFTDGSEDKPTVVEPKHRDRSDVDGTVRAEHARRRRPDGRTFSRSLGRARAARDDASARRDSDAATGNRSPTPAPGIDGRAAAARQLRPADDGHAGLSRRARRRSRRVRGDARNAVGAGS